MSEPFPTATAKLGHCQGCGQFRTLGEWRQSNRDKVEVCRRCWPQRRHILIARKEAKKRVS